MLIEKFKDLTVKNSNSNTGLIVLAMPERKSIPDRASIPDRERPNGNEPAKRYWAQMDALFYRTIGHAENAFKVNVYINIILVGVGLVLIGYSLLYSWINSLDIYSTAFGGLGILSFVATFFSTPQDKIQRTVGDLTQIQMFYRSYCLLWENIGDHQRIHKDSMTLEELDALNSQLENHTISISISGFCQNL